LSVAFSELLQTEFAPTGTTKTDEELGFGGPSELEADPKSAIENAITIALQDKPKKSRSLRIGHLYRTI
jgi:hypothetical protein